MARLDRWKKPVQILTVVTGNTADHPVVAALKEHWDRQDPPKAGLSEGGIIRASRELVFEMRDGAPYFHAVMYTLDAARMEIQIEPTVEILPPDDLSPESVSEHVRHTLAIAAGEEIPVYANTDDDEKHLLRFHREMLVHGFTAPDETGQRVRLKLRRSPGAEIDSPSYIERVSLGQWFAPAELGLIRDVVVRELRQREAAGRVLATLRSAIENLTECLDATERNEGRLQRCITENAILFGPDYVRVIPKHRLGSEFQLDYALERSNGLVEMVEIEASTHPLFNRDGNPSQALVHAEQQVLDWIDWVERHGEYARDRLPGLLSPVGYVVIGRRTALDDRAKNRLVRRNLAFQGKIVILTYDDLLSRADALLTRLTGNA